MATIKFWSEMTKATTVDGEDKVMIGRNATGEAMYADFQYLINQAGMNSSDYIPVDGNTLPDGGEGNKVTFAGPGTYTQSEGDDVVVPENSLGIITWDGDEWSLGSVIVLPTPTSRIEEWESKSYSVNDQVFYGGKVYQAKENISSNDVPENSPKWTPLNYYQFKELGDNELYILLGGGINLFNKDTVTMNARINSSGVINSDSEYAVSDFIPVEPNTDYIATQSTPTAFYDESRNFISGDTSAVDITTPPNAYFIRHSWKIENLDSGMLVEGNEPPQEYEPYRKLLAPYIKIEGENVENLKIRNSNIVNRSIGKLKQDLVSVSVDEVDFVVRGKNLLNLEDENIEMGKMISNSGVISDDAEYFVSGFIRVEPNTDYITTQSTPTAYYDKNFNHVSGDYAGVAFTTPSDAFYARHSWKIENIETAMIVEGTASEGVGAYEPYYEKLRYGKDFDNGGDEEEEYFPPYALSEMQEAREQVSRNNNKTSYLTFCFLTDTHIGRPGSTFLSERVCRELCNENFMDFFAYGGDVHDAPDVDYDGAIERISEMKKLFGNLAIPQYWARGNHDVNHKFDGDNESITSQEWYNLYNRSARHTVYMNPEDPHNNYFYSDFEDYKIRIAVLNSNDNSGTTEYFNLAQPQLDFIENEILDLPDNNWGVIFFMHFYWDQQGIAPKLKPILNDFQNQGGTVIAVISGHRHRDEASDSDGYWNIVCDCSLVEDTDYIGTKDEIAFTIFTINTDDRKILAHKVGRGDSREFTY